MLWTGLEPFLAGDCRKERIESQVLDQLVHYP